MKWKKSVRNFQSESREVETYILQKLEIKPSSAFELDLETGAAPGKVRSRKRLALEGKVGSYSLLCRSLPCGGPNQSVVVNGAVCRAPLHDLSPVSTMELGSPVSSVHL